MLITFIFGQQWEHLGLAGERIETIVVDKTNPNIIYAGSTSNFSTGKVGKLFKTTNGGINWDTLVKNITVRDIDIHPFNSNVVFVMGGVNGLTSPKILKTSNAGESWIRSDSGMSFSSITGPIHLDFNYLKPETLYASTSGIGGGDLYKSINGGFFWKKIIGPIEFQDGITTVAVNPSNPSNVFVATNATTFLFSSNDDGVNWSNRGTNDELINVIKFIGVKLYLGTGSPEINKGGLYLFSDSLNAWNHLDVPFGGTTHIRKLVIMGDTLYLRGTDYLFRVIRDSIVEKINIENNICAEVSLQNNDILVGTENGIIKKNIITSVQKIVHKPIADLLQQNYPNPFNPTTEISYEISEPSTVLLEIFNSMGQHIERFVKNHSEEGKYSFAWNASARPSGIYFVRMQAGRYSSVKKMVLMK